MHFTHWTNFSSLSFIFSRNTEEIFSDGQCCATKVDENLSYIYHMVCWPRQFYSYT
jgi:hypothetical protein